MHVAQTRSQVGPVRLGQFTRRIDDASSGSLVGFPRQVPFERGEGQGREDRGCIPFGVLMSNVCPVYGHLPQTVCAVSLYTHVCLEGFFRVRYLFHIRWQLIAVLLPFSRLSLPTRCVCLLLFLCSVFVAATCECHLPLAEEWPEGAGTGYRVH